MRSVVQLYPGPLPATPHRTSSGRGFVVSGGAGSLINGATAEGLRQAVARAIATGAVHLLEGRLRKELFGPVDTIALVDLVEELVTEMNVSNGPLVASVACDDPESADDIAAQVRRFKVGVTAMRSRGDREEVFGGLGPSWRGCFAGGRYLVEAVTAGPLGERLYGNFADYTLLPERR